MPHIISLFSGAGGLDLGFEQLCQEREGLSFHPIVAYDKEPAAVETYNYNRGSQIAREADLSELTGDDIISQIEQLQADCVPCGVLGGPPCQYFSNGNKSARDEDDPRRTLPIKYAKLLKRLNEEYEIDFFVFENVAGLAKPAHQDDFVHIIEMFEAAGFRVFSEILDAYNYGVAQKRERVFLVGWNEKHYPEAEYEFPSGKPSGLIVADKIKGLKEPRFWARDLDPDDFPEHPNHWTMNPISDKFKNPPPADLQRTTRSFRRLSWDKPSYTVAYGHNEIHVHPEGHRRLSLYEAMLLQGFPSERDGYQLIGSLTKQVTLISDAVPPPVGRALARSILRFMKQHDRVERLEVD